MSVEYKVSTYLSKFHAYHSKKGDKGEVKLFVSKIWNETDSIEEFVRIMIYMLILERICLERGFQKIRMKNRCMGILSY